MQRLLTLLLLSLTVGIASAENILNEGFEYGNHDLTSPIGWTCDDQSWLCGYMDKDHNRTPHTGNWYAFTDDEEAWMFMPIYLFPIMHYRFSTWATADGQYNLSFWAGSAPNPESMTLTLLAQEVNSPEYTKVSAYVDEIPDGCGYIGICGIRQQDGSFLTIDDIVIDMVEQFQFEANAITGDTAMYPGTQAIFRFLIRNTGYDPINVTLHPSNEYFTDFSFYSEGVNTSTYEIQPDEVAKVKVYATLRPEVTPGTTAWLDISMSIPHSCNTALVTFWVTPLDVTATAEQAVPQVSVYPNPATNYVTIEAEDLQSVILTDMNGKTLSSIAAKGNSVLLDVSALKAGVYFISAKTRSTSSFVKSILKM